MLCHYETNTGYATECSPQESKRDSSDKIRDALIEVMKHKRYDKIRIHQIIEEAGISRNTFYRKFKNKDQVLQEMIYLSFERFFENLEMDLHEFKWAFESNDNELLISNFNRLSQAAYRAIYKDQTFFSALFSSGADDCFRTSIKRILARNFGKLVRSMRQEIHSPEILDYYCEHIAGSYFHVVRKWVLSNYALSPEKVAYIHYGMINSSIAFLLPTILKDTDNPLLHKPNPDPLQFSNYIGN